MPPAAIPARSGVLCTYCEQLRLVPRPGPGWDVTRFLLLAGIAGWITIICLLVTGVLW